MRKIALLIGLIVALASLIIGVSAQTEEENIGYIVHLARSGVIMPLADEENPDFYLMMLTNAADFNAVVVTTPTLFLFNYNLRDRKSVV